MQGSSGQNDGLSQLQAARFSARLHELTTARSLSARGLAEMAGLSPSTVRKLLSGENEPKLSTMLALAAGLKLHGIEELIGPLPTEEFQRLR